MGRSRSDIYKSDHALDYLWTVTSRLERELAFWLAPEQVEFMNQGGWLAQVFAVVELTLLLEDYEFSSSIFVNHVSAVQRWREIFLSVWDGKWQRADYGYDPVSHYDYENPLYRQQHRPAIIAMFDRLESIAHFRTDVPNSDESTLTPLLSDYPLPHFSIKRWTNRDNEEVVSVARFTSDLIEQITKDIIYYLSLEKRAEILSFNLVQEVWIAGDILRFICEIYAQSPGVSARVVQSWRETTLLIWKQSNEDGGYDWDETNPSYLNVMQVFDRLEAVAEKYPAFEWGRGTT